MATIIEALNSAMHHHQAGRLQEAESVYRQILETEPDHPDALHLLGRLTHQLGQHDVAVGFIRLAIERHPNVPEFHNSLGEVYRALDKLQEAVGHYQQALSLKPDFSDARYNLGIVLHQQGQLEEARVQYELARDVNPVTAGAYYNLGAVLHEQGKLVEARVQYEEALELDPAFAAAHYNLGNLLRELGELQKAVVHFEQAIALTPDAAQVANNLGNALREQGKLDEAVARFHQAIALKADCAEAYNNLGLVSQEQGKLDEAISQYKQSLGFQPAFANAHWNLGLALLHAADYPGGFTEYEWRWKSPQFLKDCRRLLAFSPFWDGSPFSGKTLLLHAEQGLGDVIQFVRYAPLAAERGGRVILACQPELVRLLTSVPGITDVVSDEQPVPQFDVHAPLGSLPRIFGTTLETIPSRCPYITLPPNPRGLKLPTVPGTTLKVGFAWAGRPGHKHDRHRSCPVSYFLELAKLPGVALYSLQSPPIAGAFGELNGTISVHDLSGQFDDFADTAAAVCQLDLVITVDTAVAHLAGALGRPVWVLLPCMGSDWRWMTAREDSPWYPTMRLFRQTTPGEWPGVFGRVSEALQRLTEMAAE